MSPVDSKGNATPEYSAYLRVTSDKWAFGDGKGVPPPAPSVTFDQFIKTIQEDKVVNQNYARTIPKIQREIFENSARSNGAHVFESQALSIVEKAYRLGIVDHNDLLIPDLAKKANK